jgi:hypothetical protein
MPISDFAAAGAAGAAGAAFDPTRLRSVRLVFDRLVAGTIVVDDIGISATTGPFTSLGSP